MATRTSSSQKIAEKAYERFLARGGEHGHDLDDWLAAESEIKAGRRRVASVSRAAAKPKAPKA